MRRTRDLTNAELAVLGLLAEKERHGYEIEAVIEQRGMRDWTEIGFSSIYHILGLLVKRGCATFRLAPARGRGSPRKVYRITPSGRKAYVSGVIDALSRPQMLFPLIQQGLAGLPCIDPGEATAALDRYERLLTERASLVKRKNVVGLPAHVAYMFEYSEWMVNAERAWVRKLAGRIGGKGRGRRGT